MTLGAHVVELRNRLLISALGIVLGMVAGFYFGTFVIELLSQPIYEIAASKNASLNFDTITSGFDLRMRIALTVGVVLSSPIWLYHIWAYFVPALSRREIGYAVGFLGSAIPLFLAGCYAGWSVFPNIVKLMAGFAPDNASNYFPALGYFQFALTLMLVVGVAFVLPVFLVLLNFVGILTASSIIKGWRVAILVITLFCAMATPAADVISMLVLAVPMVALYFAAYGVAFIHDRLAARRLAKEGLA